MLFATDKLPFYSKPNQMHQYLKFTLFWNGTLHVSDGLSVHHQEFQDCTYSNRHLSNRYCCLLPNSSLELMMMDGKTARNMYSVISK